MANSESFRKLRRIRRAAAYCEQHGLETREGVELLAELDRHAGERGEWRATRRGFLGAAGKVAAAGALASIPGTAAWAAPPARDVRVAVVGAGLAGLACADTLKSKGVRATVFEASDRVGGRCYSLRGFFPGQTAERGGEFIDTLHSTMRGYAKRFGLGLEDLSKEAGEVFYFANGRLHHEAAVVEEYRQLVPAMRADLQRSSGAPTAENHTQGDIELDFTTLKEWLVTRGAGPLISAIVEAAYIGEYGREIDEQSCLNFLLFAHADRRAKFEPFGVYSDERFHVVEGNDAIPAGLATGLVGQIELGTKLVAAARDSAGRVVLTFEERSRTTTSRTFDAVVFAIPFSTLRDVDLKPSLGLPGWKLDAIRNLVYGTNAKVIVGFGGRPWKALGGNGTSYAKGLANLQGTWETNPIRATASRAVLTDYTGGRLGERLNPMNVQLEAERFLRDLDRVFAGASTTATRDSRGKLNADLWHWPSFPLSKGSYTCNQPGYFTTIADTEGKPVGNLYFAGEHANSFYVWQGFMEGAAVSGLDAAAQLLDDLKFGRL
ncbi:MAG TPA: FAD-dependent oxidoreductase [Gaiellaceae bacterium]|nr:FAD-dependent oxidoreductase [Gaiellaceae bacterium]